MHGYLRTVCDGEKIEYTEDDTILELTKKILDYHTRLPKTGTRHHDVETIVRSSAAILDVLNPLRNKASMAHPSKDLLQEPEAMLIINITRSLLRYLDRKLNAG